MKFCSSHEAIEHKNSETCTATEFPIKDELMDFAMVKIAGRYPESRYLINRECKEIAFVKEGSGKVVVDGKEQLLNPGDVVLIEAGEKIYWEGDMVLLISCRPAWNMSQHQYVD